MNPDIRRLEERLREAMLRSDVPALDALIDDRLRFVGPDGRVHGKADDLEAHRSGALRLTRLDIEELLIEPHGSTAITVALASLAGAVAGQAFEGRFRYTRTWLRGGDAGWKIVSGSVLACPPEAPGLSS